MSGNVERNEPLTRSPQVVVVGGGPAGLASAVALGSMGIEVLVLERSTWPRDKVCGEGLMPVGVESLQRLGVFDRIDPEHLRAFRGIRWIGSTGETAEADFASGPGYGIRRTALSRALFEVASELPSVTLSPNSYLLRLDVSDEVVTLRVRRSGGIDIITTCLVIGADGRNSKVRQLAELEGKPAVPVQRWGARQHFRAPAWTDRVEVWWADGIEAYVTPSGDQQVEIAFLWDKARFTPSQKGKKLVEGLLEHFPELKSRLGSDLPAELSKSAAVGPLARGSSSASADRVLLVGDALGYVDGITGEGISVALSQVETLRDDLPELIRSDRLSQRDLQPVSRRLTAHFAATVPLVKAALLLARFPMLRELAIRGLSATQSVFTHLLEANMGKRPIYALPVVGVLQFVWAILRSALPSSANQRRIAIRERASS